MPRYLLCRPSGGLNDTLVQISWCLDYAIRHKRTLLLDTSQSGLGLDFGEIFDLGAFPVVVEDHSPSKSAELNRLTTWPISIQGRIDEYRAVGLTERIGLFEENTLQNISFNRRRNYPQQLLVHHGGGGGTPSKRLLELLKIRNGLAARIQADLNRLPEEYDAVHIRNTDYKSSWREILIRVSRKSDGVTPIVVFSDDDLVLQTCGEVDKIFTPSPVRKMRPLRGPLHKQGEASIQLRRDMALEMLAELVGMSLARNYFYSRTLGRNGSPKSPVSGFSSLIVLLRATLPASGALGLGQSGSKRLVGQSVRVWLLKDETMAILKFVGFYYRKSRSWIGRKLGR